MNKQSTEYLTARRDKAMRLYRNSALNMLNASQAKKVKSLWIPNKINSSRLSEAAGLLPNSR